MSKIAGTSFVRRRQMARALTGSLGQRPPESSVTKISAKRAGLILAWGNAAGILHTKD
jgi:hypothetical protein